MNNKMITLGIVLAIVLACGLMSFVSVFTAKNIAIGKEQTVLATKSDIQVKQKRRFDLITKLVQVVEENSKYEKSTLVDITKMRSTITGTGNETINATAFFKAVAEAYPTLKANDSYINLMNELSLSENMIAETRTAYNTEVKDYKTYVMSFPNSIYLSIMGYEIQNFQYLEFENTDLPENLFEK